MAISFSLPFSSPRPHPRLNFLPSIRFTSGSIRWPIPVNNEEKNPVRNNSMNLFSNRAEIISLIRGMYEDNLG